jgi:myo-inositol 2-dehydrogenase/D-chiro-inositol 1-dehydrogenase
MRVGVVGAGGIAAPHVAAWTALGAQVHVYSVGGASALALRFGSRVVTGLAACIDEAEVVDVCTPTFTHDEIVLAAAAAGRHVVCEKPLSLDHRRAARLVAACRESGVQLLPGQVVRYFPEYEAAHRLVRDGTIGQVAVMRLSRSTAMPTAPWFAEPELSGGPVVDQMIHDFDFARWVAGDVVSVYAQAAGDGTAPISAHALLRHENGAITQVTGGWGNPDTPFRTTYSIRGTAGGLDHDSLSCTPLRWDTDGTAASAGGLLPDFDGVDSPYRRELADFARSIREGTAPRVSAEDSLAALDIALAAAASCRSGRPVDPKEVRG